MRDARAALAAAGDVVVQETRARGDEVRIAHEAAFDHARALVVMGGDGTVSGAARGLIERRSSVPLAILAAGTGNDFAKSLEMPVRDPVALAACIARGGSRRIDAGAVDDVTFVNAAGFGFDAAVVARTSQRGILGGAAGYALAALSSLHAYEGFTAALNDSDAARHLMLVFANGRHFGGIFRIAPDARLDDGVLDVVDIRNAGTLRRLRILASAARGAHVRCPEVHTARTSDVTLTFDAPPQFEADGELHQAVDRVVRVKCLPAAFNVVA